MLGGDELVLHAGFKGIDITFDIPDIKDDENFIKSKRNGVIVFPDLKLPCVNLWLQLKERDDYSDDDYSNRFYFDCKKVGVQEAMFQIGSNSNQGKYRMISVLEDHDPLSSSG